MWSASEWAVNPNHWTWACVSNSLFHIIAHKRVFQIEGCLITHSYFNVKGNRIFSSSFSTFEAVFNFGENLTIGFQFHFGEYRLNANETKCVYYDRKNVCDLYLNEINFAETSIKWGFSQQKCRPKNVARTVRLEVAVSCAFTFGKM